MKPSHSLAGLLLSAVAAVAQTVVPISPDSHSTGLSTAIRSEARTMQVLISSAFLGSIPVNASITGISFRLYDEAFTWPVEELSWENYDVQVSGSVNALGDLSETFDENIGSDVVMARSGALSLTAESYPGGGSPNDFGVEIVFTNHYIYTGSDLLITIRHSGNGVSDEALEATWEPGGYQVLTGDGYDAVTGSANAFTISRISYSTVPEPSFALLAILALPVIAFRRSPRN